MTRTSRILETLLLVLVAGGAGRAQQVPCPPGTASGVICLQGALTGALLAGQVYHVFPNSFVPAGQSLTISPGAILKFGGVNSPFIVDGTLDVGPGAILSSIADDTAGGDTNGDGASFGTPGDWGGVRLNDGADATEIVDAEIRFAATGLDLFRADVSITGTIVSRCSDAGLSLNGNSFPTVAFSRFDDNGRAVRDVPIGAVPGFTCNEAAGNGTSDTLQITDDTFAGSLVIQAANTLNADGVLHVCVAITIPVGQALAIGPGVIWKWGPCGLPIARQMFVQGTLNATNVIFTSIHDDSVGGDTNKNGGATVPGPGDWSNLRFEAGSDASTLDTVVVRYAGAFGTQEAIQLVQADITMTNVLVKDTNRQALSLEHSSFPTVTGCSFRDNAGNAVNNVPVMAIPGFSDNAASGNAGGNHLRIDDDNPAVSGLSTVTGNLTLDPANSLNGDGLFVAGVSLRVIPGVTLTLPGGVVIKWDGDSFLAVEGTIAATGGAGSPVILTSIRDDTVLGDSNLDGGATLPAPGDWGSIEFEPGSGASTLDHLVARYGGGVLPYVVRITNASPTLQGCVIEQGASTAILVQLDSRPTIGGCTIDDNGGYAITGLRLDAVPFLTDNEAQGNALGDYLRVTDDALGGAVTIAPINTLNQDGVLVVSGSVDVLATDHLSLLAGMVWKWETSASLSVTGTLTCAGNAAQPVVFTSQGDPDFGPSGTAGAPPGAPGQWIGLEFAPGAAASVLDEVVVRFAGAVGRAAIALSGADVSLTGVSVRQCTADALDLGGTSHPSVLGCSFEQNGFAVDRVPIGALPGFAGCTAAGNAGGDYQRVTAGSVAGALVLESSQSLGGGPIVLQTDLTVGSGARLTIEGGVLLKFDGLRQVATSSSGVLVIAGSAATPAIMTGLRDDVIGGDTNKDGAATTPAPGDWFGLTIASQGCILQGLRIRHAGAQNTPAVELNGTDTLLLDSLVESSLADALSLAGTAHPEVRRTHLSNNGFAVDDVPLDALAGFRDVTASGNASGDYIRVTTAAWSGTATVSRFNALNGDGVFGLATSIIVDSGDTLNLRQGVTFKWSGANRNVTINGTLNVEGTGSEPVTFTPITDDVVGGDTNKDGSATAPAPGDWGGLFFTTASGPSIVEHLSARYGGQSSFAAIRFLSPATRADAVRADHSITNGLNVFNLDGPLTNAIAFGNQGTGILCFGGAFDVLHATSAGNELRGIVRAGGYTGLIANTIAWANASGNYANVGPGELVASNGDPARAGAHGNIDADPLFLDAANGDLRLAPTSPCLNTADLPLSLPLVLDFTDASRVLDHDLSGSALPDMGAHERPAYTLTVAGEPRIGTTLVLEAGGGPPGTALYALGLLDATLFLPPLGHLAIGSPSAILFLGALPTGVPLPLPIPPIPALEPLRFGIQAAALPTATTGTGNLTNTHQTRLFN